MSPIVMRVSGSSMRPLLSSGRRVLVDTAVASADLLPGDIVAVKPRGGPLLLHRLVERRKNGDFFTRGDNCVRREGPLRPEQIVGLLVGVEDVAHAGCWRPQRASVARILAMISSLRPRRLARLARIFLGPFAFGAPFRAADGDFGRFSRVARASGDDSDDVECQELGDEFVIHDKRSGDVHVLNSLARAIYQWAREGLDRETIVDKIASAYPDEDRAELRKNVEDVMGLLESLDVLR